MRELVAQQSTSAASPAALDEDAEPSLRGQTLGEDVFRGEQECVTATVANSYR
ncbi:hypothetical protein [Streptomyces lavendulae]|uniref:hypothetical protein n=1 Tax=Streptomyces lavendulae TaxID=1914 RepID=UPI0031ED2D7E